MKVYTVFFLVKNLRPLLLKNPNLSSPPYLSFRKASENSGESPEIKRITKIIAGNGISKTEASRLNKTIKEEITAWLNRPIKKKFSHLFIDGIFLKISRKIISKEAILCAVGITESGEKQHCLFHKMSNLRAKCPRSEWPLIKAKIHKIYSLGL